MESVELVRLIVSLAIGVVATFLGFLRLIHGGPPATRASTISGMASLWEKLEPLLRQTFA